MNNWWAMLVVLLSVGCVGAAGDLDAGSIDAGALDAGPIDAGPLDAGPLDAGPLDAGLLDAGSVDAGPVDAGPLDAGPVDAGPVDAGPPDAGTDPTPTMTTIAGKTIVGPITAVTGQVIENVHVVNHTGPCIVINAQTDVTIRDSEIGPCGDTSNVVGDVGVFINASTRITLERNVLHDAATLIEGNDVRGPVSIRHNLFFNIRGTSYEASAIQFGESRNHAGAIQITCNTIDDRLVTTFPMAGGRQRRNEDHLSMYNSGGTSAFPIEIGWNRIRGALDGWGGISGTGMQLGDSPAGGGNPGSNTPGFIYAHHNVVYWVNGAGIAFAGGPAGNRSEYNLVDNRGSGPGPSASPGGAQVLGQGTSDTGWSYAARRYDTSQPMAVTFKGNLGNSSLWAYDNDGHQGGSAADIFNFATSTGVTVVDQGGNSFQETASPFGTVPGVDTIWDLPVAAACLE